MTQTVTDAWVTPYLVGKWWESGGMGVQAWVAHFIMPLTSTHILRLFPCTCLHTTSDDNQTRPHKKHKQHDKQHHHGGGAAHPSSNVDLMKNPCRLRGGRPSTDFF